jgi:hypothetical protein
MYSAHLEQTPLDLASRWRKRIWRRVRSTIEARFNGQGSRIFNSQTFALNACAPGRYVLKLGRGHRDVAGELKRKFCHVTAIDFGGGNRVTKIEPRLPDNVAWFDEILLLDLLDQLSAPEVFMRELRQKMARRGSEVIITTSNVVSFIRRVLLVLGGLARDRVTIRGKEQRGHFTFKSLRALLEQAGYEIVEARGIPMPASVPGGASRWSRAWLKLNRGLFKVSKHLFAHQICMRARPLAVVRQSVRESSSNTSELFPSTVERVA